jgi:acetamidase/formamidase
VQSGDIVTIETLTQHAYDDYERMIKGDSGAESVFHWTPDRKNVDRRGAGPVDASIYGRGSGEGFGVHICTGPIYVKDAAPGDVLEVRILDLMPRLSANAKFAGRAFGSNAAAWWGFHYDDLLTEPKPREVVTIYEIDCAAEGSCAHAVYNFRWTPQRDPYGVVHPTIDYPGVPVDHSSIIENHDVLRNVRIPTRPHFGVIAVAPVESGVVDSVPPAYFGGNIDNWRVGKGASVYLRVGVEGALLSVGDPHASQGDSELCGTAIECSLTGVFQLVLHKPRDQEGQFFADLESPLIETPEEWVLQGFSHPDYLREFGARARSEIYTQSSLDLAMRDAFRKARTFLMSAQGLSEDEAISLMSVAVDFGVTQVVDGNWGVHAIIRKALFKDRGAADGGNAPDRAAPPKPPVPPFPESQGS